MAHLELKHQMLRSLTDVIPVLVSHIDRNEIYQYCNAYYLHMFGVRREDIVGKSVREFFGEDSYRSIKPYLDRALNGEATWFERVAIARGEVRILKGQYVPEFDLDGTVIGLYVAAWDVTEARQREQELSEQVCKDALTGLLSRTAMLSILPTEIEMQYKHRDGLAVLFLDIDRFKQVNDTYGHAAGDSLLVVFGERVRSSIRETDYVARFGGDEFVVVLTSLDSFAATERVCQKIIDSVGRPIRIGSANYSISTSIGAAYVKNRQLAAHQLLAEADSLLHSATESGRNKYRSADLSVQN